MDLVAHKLSSLIIISSLLLSGTAATGKDKDNQLEQSIRRLMNVGEVPGLSIVLIKDGRISWRGNFGVKNVETKQPIDDDTVFEAASLSKPVFAYAVLKLVDAGKLDLDKPLSEYLPGSPVENDDRGKLITARMALTHTTGFQNEATTSQPLKLYFRPGERFSYSGAGFLYLQTVVEHLTGEDLESFMKRTVFAPLKMANSSYIWQERYENMMASGHRSNGSVSEIRKTKIARAYATLRTTTTDYAKFVIAMLNGTGLTQGSARHMLSIQTKVDERCFSCLDKVPTSFSPEIFWGLGWGIEQTGKRNAFWHWGDNSGEYHNFVIAYPKEKLGVIVFTNSGNGHSIIPEIVSQAVGGTHPVFAWMGYEQYNSPPKVLYRDILANGEQEIRKYRESRKTAATRLSERQINSIGYLLIGKKKVKEAIEIFKINVEDYPNSSNVYDSLGEGYMIDGEKELAIKNYQKSLELDPGNANAAAMIKKLRAN